MRDFTLIALTVGSFFNGLFLAYATVAAFWWSLLIQGPHDVSAWAVPLVVAMLWTSPIVILLSICGGWHFYRIGKNREALFAMFVWMPIYAVGYLIV